MMGKGHTRVKSCTCNPHLAPTRWSPPLQLPTGVLLLPRSNGEVPGLQWLRTIALDTALDRLVSLDPALQHGLNSRGASRLGLESSAGSLSSGFLDSRRQLRAARHSTVSLLLSNRFFGMPVTLTTLLLVLLNSFPFIACIHAFTLHQCGQTAESTLLIQILFFSQLPLVYWLETSLACFKNPLEQTWKPS